MNRPLHPTHLQKVGSELAVAWDDGKESYLPLEMLRRHCPCATCGGEPDVLGRLVRPDVTYSQGSFELSGWETVGGYGIQPSWADGHRTGIYTYPYLRKLGEAAGSQAS